jgi:3-(3-hydroxy-phenyl)propionate hydroxylase
MKLGWSADEPPDTGLIGSVCQELGQIICIADEAVAAERDRRMIADLAARNGTPVPTDICQLGSGAWCEESAHAGELAVQGVVEASGQRGRFDQVVGQGWVVLAYEADPAQALTAQQRQQLAQLEGITVRLATRGGKGDAIDLEGTFKRWLERIDARYALIRPDFYVAVTAKSPEAFQARFAKVMGALHLTGVPALAAE